MNSKIVKIDCDQIVDTLNISIEISKLSCKICCYLLVNPKICYNKKCGQIFCNDCINTSDQDTPCPFCNLQCDKMNFSTTNLDPNLILVLKNLKVFCKHIDCENKIIPLEDYMSHITIDKQIEESKCLVNDCNVNWKKLKKCTICNLISCKKCVMLYYINWKIQCRKCIEENNSELTFDNNQEQTNCNKCNSLIKVMTNPFLVSKCAVCFNINCFKCVTMCPICKLDVCISCFESCFKCGMSNNNSHVCINCYRNNVQLGLFHKCPTCKKKYCLNCVSTCNACHRILCCEKKTKCDSCDETVCSRHLYQCTKCSNNKKVCLKQCTYTCQICLQKSTLFCNENNHSVLAQAVLSCSHQLCSKCIDRCTSCKQEKCQLCLTAKMFNCNICNSNLCFKCTNFCYKCNIAFCVFHKCIVCSCLMEDCFSCYIKENKLICQICDKDLENCEECIKKCICSFKCYMKYSASKESDHNCPIFLCVECGIEQNKRHSSIKNNNNNGDNNNNDESSLINDEESFYVSRSRKKLDESDKVMIACQESCICIIY